MIIPNIIFTYFLIIINFQPNSAQTRKFRILGGNGTRPGEYRYMVATLVHGSVNNCGGGIISDRFILSAGHCFLDADNNFKYPRVKIVAGTNDLLNFNDPNRIEIVAEKIYVPASYRYSIDLHDIAVLKLKESLDLKHNENLQKLALPTGTEKYVGIHAVVAGFGWDQYSYKINENGEVEESGSDTGKLMSADVVTYDNIECQKHYEEMIYGSFLCGKMTKDNESEMYAVCHGDSGSPLVYESNIVIGIASASYLCDERTIPMVYTRVSSFIGFIENAMSDNTTDMIYKEFDW